MEELQKKRIIISKKNLFHIALFFLYFISYLFLLTKYGMSTDQARFRYYFLALCIVVEFFILIKNKGLLFYKKAKHNSLLLFIPLGITFAIQSMIMATTNGGPLSGRTFTQIFLVLSPPIYAYLLVNNTDKKTINIIMKSATIISILGYLLESPHTLLDFFNIDKLSSIFTNHSFTESNTYPEIFLQLFFYFNYFTYIDKQKQISNSKRFTIITALFTLLCYKRLSVLIVAITPITNFIINKIKKKMKGTIIILLLTVLFAILTIIYFGMLEHRLFTNVDIYKLSTGRDYILSIWEKYDYMSLGYGSSMLMIGRYLELDLVEILLELGMPCLLFFCFTYLNAAKKTTYTIVTACYFLLNLLTASGLPYTAGPILMFISMMTIESTASISKKEAK